MQETEKKIDFNVVHRGNDLEWVRKGPKSRNIEVE